MCPKSLSNCMLWAPLRNPVMMPIWLIRQVSAEDVKRKLSMLAAPLESLTLEASTSTSIEVEKRASPHRSVSLIALGQRSARLALTEMNFWFPFFDHAELISE